MSAHLVEIDVAMRFLRERGAVREGGAWRFEGASLSGEPVMAARVLRDILITKGPAGARQQSGHPVWTR